LLCGVVVWIGGFPAFLRKHSTIKDFLIVVGMVLLFLALTVLSAQFAHEPIGRRSVCQNNLRQIQIALMTYHANHERLPPPYFVDETGKRTHSWRVMLLPYLGSQQLYGRYCFDEPWDGPNNHKLVPEIPIVFQCPSNELQSHFSKGHTTYMAISGDTTAWSGKRGFYPTENAPATSVVEVPGKSLPWTCPDDPTLDEFLVLCEQHSFAWKAAHRQFDLFSEKTGVHGIVSRDGTTAFVSALATPNEWRDVIERPLTSDWHNNLPTRTARRICWEGLIPFAILLALILAPVYGNWRTKQGLAPSTSP